MRGSLRKRAYRGALKSLLAPLLARKRATENREVEVCSGASFHSPLAESAREGCWFHAASAGELESLWPVIEAWAKEGRRLVVTVFSPSAAERLRKLRERLDQSGATVAFAGFCPIEGDWEDALRRSGVGLFVTAKYEAWPDLWMSLSELSIPLIIVGARARKSFAVCKRVVKALGGGVPKLTLLTADPEDDEGLREIFPGAEIICAGEPRWDQVAARVAKGSARSAELLGRYASLPKPWGILAQVWNEDLEVWRSAVSGLAGTLWVVPHQVSEEKVKEAERFLIEAGFPSVRTSRNLSPPGRAVLVDEMGVLTELYPAMDWAYVGGGFGQGVHSTIEPAIHGLALAIGPGGAAKFPEIGQLRSLGQLTMIREAGDARSWLGSLGNSALGSREAWRNSHRERLGATGRILQLLREKQKPLMLT